MNIIDINDLRTKMWITKMKNSLREYVDQYEYCFIENYENKYDDFKIESIKVANVFVSILETKGKFILISLLFPKPFELQKIAAWLGTYIVSFNEYDEDGFYIQLAHRIKEKHLYKGIPIVFATKGKNKIYYKIDDLEDISETYYSYTKVVNTAEAKDIDIAEVFQKEETKSIKGKDNDIDKLFKE